MVELIAENRDFAPILVNTRKEPLTIEGIAVGLIRDGARKPYPQISRFQDRWLGTMNPALIGALERGDIRRGDAFAVAAQAAAGAELRRGARLLASGFPRLDAELPGGGWPRGALTELLAGHEGIGELGLLLPALATLTGAGQIVVLVAPPHAPMRRPGLPPGSGSIACAWCFRGGRAMPVGRRRGPALRRRGGHAAVARRDVSRRPAGQQPAPPAGGGGRGRRRRLLLPSGAAARLRPRRRRCACSCRRPGRQLRVQLLKRRGPPARQAILLDIRAARGFFPGISPCCGWRCIARRRRASRNRAASPPEAGRRDDFLPTLACWAGRYTPRVNLAPDALRLDIGASLRLFGGLPGLLGGCAPILPRWTFDAQLAVAATPLAALWLARPGGNAVCPDLAATRERLAAVPLPALQLAPPLARRVEGFGLRRVGDLLALPRASLGARLGKPFCSTWAAPWARSPIRKPASFFPSASSRRWNCRHRSMRRRCCCSPRSA
jgi:hypothetical protein